MPVASQQLVAGAGRLRRSATRSPGLEQPTSQDTAPELTGSVAGYPRPRSQRKPGLRNEHGHGARYSSGRMKRLETASAQLAVGVMSKVQLTNRDDPPTCVPVRSAHGRTVHHSANSQDPGLIAYECPRCGHVGVRFSSYDLKTGRRPHARMSLVASGDCGTILEERTQRALGHERSVLLLIVRGGG